MKATRLIVIVSLVCGSGAVVGVIAGVSPQRGTPESPVQWTADLAGALSRAAKAGTDVLLVLDADPNDAAAAALTRSVFKDDYAARIAGEGRQLVRIGYPAQNRADAMHVRLSDRFGVERFPAMLLLDATGRPVSAVELTGDVNVLVTRIASAAKKRELRDGLLDRAAKATGSDRARLLDEAMRLVEPFVFIAYADIAEQIVTCDPQNAAGLRSRYLAPLNERKLDEMIQQSVFPLIDQGRYSEARARVAELTAELAITTDQRQRLMAFQAQLHFSQGHRAEAGRLLEQAIALAPGSAAADRAREAQAALKAGD